MAAVQADTHATPRGEIEDLLRTWFAAVDQRDGAPPAAEWLDRHLAAEFLYLHGAGGRWEKQDILTFVSETLPLAPQEHVLRRLDSVTEEGDVVLATGEFFLRSRFPAAVEVPNALRALAATGTEYRVATVWVERDERRQCLLYQATPKLI